jgi:hypothetical protein
MNLKEIKSAPPTQLAPILRELMQLMPPDIPEPLIKIVNHIKPKALGTCTWKFVKRKDGTSYCWDTTVIELEKVILGHEETLRRVLAHELAHHEDNLVNNAEEFKKMGFDSFKLSRRFNRDDHGPSWQAIANRFNQKYGKNFVTIASDKTYVLEKSDKPFLVALEQYRGDRWFAYTVRLGPKQQKYLERQYSPWKLIKTTDGDFLKAKLGERGWSVAKGPMIHKWDDLWNNGEVVSSGNLGK